MKTVNIDDVAIGSVLAEPIVIGDVLLCKEGIPMSLSLKKSLKKFGVELVTIETIFTDRIDTNRINFSNLNNCVYLAIKQLDIDNIILCAKSLVASALEGEYQTMLNVCFEEDTVTYKHSLNVANLAVTVGMRLGLSISQLKTLAVGSLLHDIGKSCIPMEIINKPGKLTKEEFELMKQHPIIGYNIVQSNYKLAAPEKQIILQHHENWDGTGYPNNLYGTNSYKLARIVHIIDAYEAMCARRPYKEPMPRRIVREALLQKSGSMFDPRLLKQVLSILPMYTVGEEITFEGRYGIVCDNTGYNEPLIFSDGAVYKLSDFEDIKNTREELLKKQIELI